MDIRLQKMRKYAKKNLKLLKKAYKKIPRKVKKKKLKNFLLISNSPVQKLRKIIKQEKKEIREKNMVFLNINEVRKVILKKLENLHCLEQSCY